MKPSLVLSAVISLATISLALSETAQASSFGEQELDRERFAVVAAPYRHGYNLLILEQIPGQKKCWQEVGHAPTAIKPLFLDFDFTNACKRSSDSNNYSIRLNGRDYGIDYLTNIVKKDGELHLIGVPRDPSKPELHLGKTYGLTSDSLKIVLDPQWRLTKRIHGTRTTEHIYISNNSSNNLSQSDKPIAHGIQPVNPTQPHHPVTNVAPAMQPIPIHPSFGYQPSVPSNYQQPAYSQPTYQQPMLTPQQHPSAHPQQIISPPTSPQPTTVYRQPVYYSVPIQQKKNRSPQSLSLRIFR